MHSANHRAHAVAVGLLAVACLVCTPACSIKSVTPGFTSAAVTTEPAIAGDWRNQDGSIILSVRAAKVGYDAEVLVKEKNGPWKILRTRCTLFRAGGRLFADAQLADGAWEELSVAHDLLIRAHLIGRVDLEGDRLIVRMLKSEAVNKELMKDESALDHFHVENETILGAPPEKTLAFLEKHAANDAMFNDPSDALVRVRSRD